MARKRKKYTPELKAAAVKLVKESSGSKSVASIARDVDVPESCLHLWVKQHDIECSLLEGVLTRGDRRVAPALLEAWRRGCRLDGWRECFQPAVWWQTFADLGIDTAWYSQRTRPMSEVLPWDHVNVKKGRQYLEKEQHRSLVQLEVMAEAK